jgi:AcrR family transcriptional regulator
MLTAIVDLVGDVGYAETTITAIARQAGVSPNVFYEHFADREECFIAAYDAFTELILERLSRMVPSATEWDAFVFGLLDAYYGLLEDEPKAARAFLVEVDIAGSRARARRRTVFFNSARMLAEQYAEVRQQDPSLGRLPDQAFLAFVHAVRDLACDAIETDPRASLRALIPGLAQWISAAIHGAAAVQPDDSP